MTEPRKERCETCRFWSLFERGSVLDLVPSGKCKRYPPVVALDCGDVDDENWCQAVPETVFDDWCGEWQVSESNQEQDGPSYRYFALKWKQNGMFPGFSANKIVDAIERTVRTIKKIRSKCWSDIRVGLRENTKWFEFRQGVYRQMRKDGLLRSIDIDYSHKNP